VYQVHNAQQALENRQRDEIDYGRILHSTGLVIDRGDSAFFHHLFHGPAGKTNDQHTQRNKRCDRKREETRR